jgi:hypothetical protein
VAVRPAQAVKKAERAAQSSGQAQDGGGDDGFGALNLLGMQKKGDFTHGYLAFENIVFFMNFVLKRELARRESSVRQAK